MRMFAAHDYLQEVRKFASSQYWYSGLRITAGVVVPLVVLVQLDRVASGIPILWGSLFVSLTDTPGPIHHRRNGMVAAIVLNATLVLLTGYSRDYSVLLFIQIVAAAFLLTMLGVYGARAGAVGSLALVVSLITLLSLREEGKPFSDALMVAGGGAWYTVFSMLLYRLRPYRPVEQALGENIIAIADYLRARASLYTDHDLTRAFSRVMTTQSRVHRLQDQSRELLFKTRTFVSDPSPRSRSMMMIYLDCLDVFEQVMQSYHDYRSLRDQLSSTGLLPRVYGVIHQLAAAVEHVGLTVQGGRAVRKDVDLTKPIGEIREALDRIRQQENRAEACEVLERILDNVQDIAGGINKIVLYTRSETDPRVFRRAVERAGHKAVSQPITRELFMRNLTLSSNTFRHALRVTIAIATGYIVSILLSVTHPYWLLLTIVTIVRPVYSVSRRRNVARVGGTLIGASIAFALLAYIAEPTTLLAIMVVSMLMGYSLLRLHYFSFVVFLTVFIVITFHFLNPLEFNQLIVERIMDTIIGSVIAFLASRFVFPAWESETINGAMVRMVKANRRYFSAAWQALRSGDVSGVEYQQARQDAVVALTNLSDSFQSMLSEPRQSDQSPFVHQFVIANHMLTGHIAGLSAESAEHENDEALGQIVAAVESKLRTAEQHLTREAPEAGVGEPAGPIAHQAFNQLSIIHSLAREIVRITKGTVATA